MKLHQLIKTKMQIFITLYLLDIVFILLTNIKMPTIASILTLMSWKNSPSVDLSMKKVVLSQNQVQVTKSYEPTSKN